MAPSILDVLFVFAGTLTDAFFFAGNVFSKTLKQPNEEILVCAEETIAFFMA
jgi:hypothetical protein